MLWRRTEKPSRTGCPRSKLPREWPQKHSSKLYFWRCHSNIWSDIPEIASEGNTQYQHGGRGQSRGEVRTMGTEFSRRVNAWIAVSGATRDPLLAPIAQCGKLLKRDWNGKGTGRCRGGAGSALSRARLQLRFVLRGIKSMGTACSRRPRPRQNGEADSPRRPIK